MNDTPLTPKKTKAKKPPAGAKAATKTCPECGGRRVLADPYDVYDVDIPDPCRRCDGLGTILVTRPIPTD